ncbi:MAG: TldD/PmbA family protein [Thermoplasmatota archaeon]
MEPTDAESWTERAVELAQQRLSAFEVRLDIQEDRRWVLRNGQLRSAGRSHVGGIGIRAFEGAASAYAYTNELTHHALRDLVDQAGRLAQANARQGWDGFAPDLHDHKGRHTPDVREHPHDVPDEAAYGLLRRAEEAALEEVPGQVAQVGFGARRGLTVVANSTGGHVVSENLLSTLLVQTLARDGARHGSGNEWRGGELGFGDYEDEGGPEALGRAAGRAAKVDLEAKPITAGRYRTLCDNKLTGIMVHESFGHLTEYDVVAPGWSVLQDRLGERLAPRDVTIRDVPRMPGPVKHGVVVPFDQEGTPGRDVTLVDQGALTAYLHGRDSASDQDVAATGSARALNVSHAPIVRMRNTFMEPGDHSQEEALEALGTGVYLQGGRGGAPRSDGSFTFTSEGGYWVEDGELSHPIKMATINGNILDFFGNIEAITDDFRLRTTFFGGCGKWDQSLIHVGTGGPQVLVSEALVGGQVA